jgi:hypothetical protein
MWHVWGRGEVPAGFRWESLRQRDHLEDIGVNRRIILKWIIKTGWEGVYWIYVGQEREG